MPTTGTPDSPWLAKLHSLAECKAAGLVPDILSPIPTEDLLLSGYCAICQKPTQFRLGMEHYHEKWGYFFREALSCSHCTFNARMRAALQYLGDLALPKNAKIYMTEQVTPMFRYVSERYPNTQGSEYIPGRELGSVHAGIRCEDLQALTFASDSFDVILSLDVLEHIPDYRAGLLEMRRVLRKKGTLILTCPFIMQLATIRAQARLNDRGEVEHLIPVPEYHGNPLGPPSLSFNTFGWQLLDDMRDAGFSEVHLIAYRNRELGYVGGPFPLMVGIA